MDLKNSFVEKSDEELIIILRTGNLEVQDFLINKYKNIVKQKAHSYFMDGSDKEDIIQEGMIGLFKAIRDYNNSKNKKFYPFAVLCINRQIFSAIKSSTRKKHSPLNESISLNKEIFSENGNDAFINLLEADKSFNPEDLLIELENKIFIREYINTSLSSFELEVLNLYLKNKNYKEIAAILSKDEKSIDNAIQRIRNKIEKVINKN